MVAKLYCVTSADKTKLNGVYFQVTCTFELVAIWPIALIGRLRFLFLSLMFLIRTSAKAYFCLAPLLLLPLPPPPPPLLPPPPPLLPSPPTSSGSAVPMELLELNIYFYLDTHHEIKTQKKTDIVQSERGRVEWKKLCSLVITIKILDVILSNFYSLKISNHWYIKERYSLQKPFSLSRIKHYTKLF